MFFQLLINGLIAGSVYALVAAGFSCVYTTNRFVHFAHGSTVTVCSFFLFWLLEYLHIPFIACTALVVLFAGGLGYTMHACIYLPLRKKGASSSILLIASLALMYFLNNLMQLLFGADVKILSVITESTGINIWGAYITPLQIVVIITALVLLAFVWIFTKKSKLGKLMRAVADNPELARISGINTTSIQHWSFVIGSAIAGVAAILISLEYNIESIMGTNYMIHGFTGAVIGGVSSLPGSILGSYMLGLIENFGIWFLPSGYKSAIAFVLLLIFLLIRPQGILGMNKGIREEKI